MKTITPFDPDTGRFGAVLQVPDAAAERYKPFKEGRFDKRLKRVDVATGDVVAYERPATEIEAERKAARNRRARQRIARLELSQLRSMRELAIDPNNGTAKRRLAEIEAEIVGLRVDLA